MENASKALLMAAGVLVGVLLLSLAVFLFTIFGNFGSDMTTQMNEKNLSEFNAQFIKYQSYQDEDGKWQNLCRAQDVVTIANLAKENNSQYDYSKADEETEYYYVKVIVITGHTQRKNYETASLDEYIKFLKDYSGSTSTTNGSFDVTYFKCRDILTNPNSKRVCSVTFEQM